MRLVRLLLNKIPQGPLTKRSPDIPSHNKMTGLKWSELKHHYSIIPMIGLTVVASGIAGYYVFRLATKHPEVSWTKSNSEPWNDYRNKQYKFTNYADGDYSNSSPPKSSFSK